MAKVQITLPTEMEKKLVVLQGRSEVIIKNMLEAGGEEAVRHVRSSLVAVIGKNTTRKSRSTGELERSLGSSPPLLNSKGVWDTKIGFRESRPGNATNAKVANILEHGRQGQPPRPFLAPARTRSKKPLTEVMEKVFKREVERL